MKQEGFWQTKRVHESNLSSNPVIVPGMDGVGTLQYSSLGSKAPTEYFVTTDEPSSSSFAGALKMLYAKQVDLLSRDLPEEAQATDGYVQLLRTEVTRGLFDPSVEIDYSLEPDSPSQIRSFIDKTFFDPSPTEEGLRVTGNIISQLRSQKEVEAIVDTLSDPEKREDLAKRLADHLYYLDGQKYKMYGNISQDVDIFVISSGQVIVNSQIALPGHTIPSEFCLSILPVHDDGTDVLVYDSCTTTGMYRGDKYATFDYGNGIVYDKSKRVLYTDGDAVPYGCVPLGSIIGLAKRKEHSL
jgi:hypothetical protein